MTDCISPSLPIGVWRVFAITNASLTSSIAFFFGLNGAMRPLYQMSAGWLNVSQGSSTSISSQMQRRCLFVPFHAIDC